jgi:integrase
LSQVKPIHVTEYFASKLEYSHSFTKRSKFLLNAAFECAIDNDFCIKNPVRRAEIAKKTQPEREAFNENEINTIIDFAKTDERFGVAMYILFNTGIRSGEMRAMSAEQIDLENGIVTIDRAVKRTEELGKPKNGKTRYVPLDDEAIAFLASKIDKNAKYLVGGDCYVSRHSFRQRFNYFFDRLNKWLAAQGREPIGRKNPHASRHSCATAWQRRGMPIAIVAALLGHCSTEVTDKYTHLGDIETLAEAVRKYSVLSKSA